MHKGQTKEMSSRSCLLMANIGYQKLSFDRTLRSRQTSQGPPFHKGTMTYCL